jgi:formylglycine-generating enzyme required for sulfatase activity
MSPETYRYAGFISYRHVEPDRRWAVWLHRALERYRVPRSARRELRLPACVGRAFRDEDEVSASSDLNAEIEKALKESRFLIVVCSPRAPESKWVNREIERFREMGRGDRILALLVEGEPKEAFPPALRAIRRVAAPDARPTDIIEEIEPLAADVRETRLGSGSHMRRVAKLRIVSTLLGCRFDDLRRREQERRQRLMAATTIAALALAAILGGLALIAVNQRNQKESALQGKAAALDDYDRLGDVPKLRDLIAEADELWPCEPSKAPAMRSWITRAEELERRLPGHREVLERLRRAAVLVAPESREESRPTESRPNWRLPSPSDQFKHDTTAKLVADLSAFVDPDPHKGLLADVRARLAFAQSVEHETIKKYSDAWKRAMESIASSPKYHGLAIKPQLGLIPIDQDPKSELWEFVHLQTAAPGTDPIPKHGADGTLVVTQDTGLVFVLLPGGTFRMGAVKNLSDEDTPANASNVDPKAGDDELPVTTVPLDPFFLSKYEMTQGQWHRLVGKNPSQYRPSPNIGGKPVDLRNPVEMVSWEDCDLWLGWRLGLMLPTEAQWEYGARAGTTTPRWTGIGTNGLQNAANLADAFCQQNGGQPSFRYESWNDGYTVHAPAGTFGPNPFGLHDVLGNVWEWCRDWYGSYNLKPRTGDGLRDRSTSRFRVLRGGAWCDDASQARSANRGRNAPKLRGLELGVRPARTLDR